MRSNNRIGTFPSHRRDSPSSPSSRSLGYGSFDGNVDLASPSSPSPSSPLFQTETQQQYGSYHDNGSVSRVGTMTPGKYREYRLRESTPTSPGAALKQWMLDTWRVMVQYISIPIKKIKPDYSIGRRDTLETSWIQPEVLVDEETRQTLERYREFVSTPYDSENTEHEQLLAHLWRVCMGDRVPLESRISMSWQNLGFQGKDPASDFRAVGVFGLRCLLYYAGEYPRRFEKQFQGNRSTDQDLSSYPFAIAGLNCVMLLFDILGYGITTKQTTNYAAKKRFIDMLMMHGGPHMTLHSFEKELRQSFENGYQGEHISSDRKQRHNSSPAKVIVREANILDFGYNDGNDNVDLSANMNDLKMQEQEQESKKHKNKKKTSKKRKSKRNNILFEELFVCSFRILDTQWNRARATYTNFPEIFKLTKSRMEELLETYFFTVEDVIDFNKRGSV